MTGREPLAALVARLRDENGALPFAETWARVTPSEAQRLLAAVEAGTKCADALRWARRFGRVFQHSADCVVWRGTASACNCGYDAQELPVDSALALWDSIAVAPASHGSPEQGR